MHLRIHKDGTIEYPYDAVRQIRQEYPNTSFPREIPPELLARYGIHEVVPVPKPTVKITEKAVQLAPTFSAVDNAWYQTWQVVALDAEELIELRREIAQRIREKRDQLLAASDWTQLADTKVDIAAWAAYRQQLRDLPSLPGFPLNIQWPTPPA